MNTNKRRLDSSGSANRYVALFDILGFKNLVENNDLAAVVKFFESFIKLIRSGKVLLEGHLTMDGKHHPLGYKLFSDTILLYSQDTSFDSLHNLVLYCLVLIREGLLQGIPVRGAITKGEVFIDKDIFIGKPIVQAHVMEQRQEWLGCWIDDVCLENLSGEERWRLDGDMIVPYLIPLKQSEPEQSLWAINWTVSIYIQDKQTDTFDQIDRMFAVGSKGNECDPNVKRKKVNTQKFAGYCFSNMKGLLADKLVLK
jgi:hypothetical protein